MNDLTRKTFLKRVALASAAATASSLIPGVAFGKGVPRDVDPTRVRPAGRIETNPFAVAQTAVVIVRAAPARPR